jgi:DNA-binding NtrC family response regulator
VPGSPGLPLPLFASPSNASMNSPSDGIDALARTFAESPVPIYVVDRRRRIVYANQALGDWLEVPVADLLDRQTAYHGDPSDSKIDAGLLGLCPPPSALRGQSQQGTISCVGRAGTLRHRRANFWPLEPRDKPADGPVVVLVEPHDLNPDELAAALASTAPPDQFHLALAQWRRTEFAPYAAATLLGNSPAIRRAAQQVRGAASSGTNVLVTGPTAADLRGVAEAIHYLAAPSHDTQLIRLEPPLSLPEELRKALASATSGRGTLLLVDIAEFDAHQQQDLATQLAFPKFKWRVIATLPDASTSPLLPALYNSLSTVEVRLPPLAERLEDLPLLAQWQVERLNRDSPKQIEGFTPDALERMSLYDWPGEQQELYEVVAAAHEQAQGPVIEASDLPPLVRHAVSHAQFLRQEVEPLDLDQYLHQVEQFLLQRAMELAKGNKAEAARLLGLSRPRLYRKLEGQGLESAPPKERRPRPPRRPREAQLPAIEVKDDIEFLPIDPVEGEEDPS